MATNPNEKQEASKAPPPLFGGGLFGNAPPPGTGLFGNASKPGLGGSLFGAASPSSAPVAFSPAGQHQPITPLFGNTSGQPQSAPSSMEASKAPSLFSGGFGAFGASKPADAGQNKLGLSLFGQGTSTSPIPSLFGPPKTAGQSEQPPVTTSTPANPAPTTTTPLTLSFGSTQETKKEEPAKKTEGQSLFGSSTPSTGPLFGGTSLFGQPAKRAEGDKKDQKNPVIGSLFGGSTSSVPPVPKESNPAKKSEAPFGLSSITPTSAPIFQASKAPAPKATQVKDANTQQTPRNPLAGSLFSGHPSGSLFGAGSNGFSAPSLFGGVTPTPLTGISPVPIITPAPSLFQAPTPKAPSLFGSPPTGSLFGVPAPSTAQPPAATTEKPKPTDAPTTLLSQSMPKSQKPAPKQPQQGQTLTSKTEGSGKTQPPKLAASTFLSNDSKQPKKDGAAMPSLFGGSTATGLFSNKPAEPTPLPAPKTQPFSTASQPKPIIESRPDTSLPSLTERRRKEPAADPEHSQTIRSNESAESSLLTKEKTHNDFATRQSKNTGTAEGAGTGSGPKLFSFLKPRQANTAQVIDFKALMQERQGEMFSTFLSQSSPRIISSIKMYFTVRREPFKLREQPPNTTQKERFLFDFTNLFMKVQGLSDESYQLVGQFLRRVISDQRYERLLFKDGALSVEYFRNHMIYQVGLGNTFSLNEAGSRELQFLVERMVNKWNVERVGILNFLLGHSDLMKKPSDLFSYLFRHLLQMDGKFIQTQNKQYAAFIKDFQYLTKRKLLQVIAFYNGRLREFKLILPEEIKGIVMLLQASKEEVNEVALKVLLNSLNFKQPKEIPGDVFQAIRQTKSECMMPLRALAHKLTSKRHDFVPPPKELYKYIRGDEWVDWFDVYLTDSGKEGVQLQTGEAEQILQSLCSISGPLLLQRMMDNRKGLQGLQRFFNLLRDQNMVTLYYRLLQACVYDEKSITKVNEFYFQKMHFNLEYQQVIEYVIAFNQQQLHANQEAVLAILEVKLGLLAKIIQVAPEKLVELERFLFYHDYNKHKKFRANIPQEFPRAEGEKLVHLFLDTVNIVSLKGIPNRILHRIFRVLAHLLRIQQTQEVVLAALRTNRPSFAFLNTPLHPLTLNALNALLEEVLSGHYLHDLAADYAQAREDELRAQSFYPFRYREAELANLMRHQNTGTVGSGQFSIYWMNQLVRVVAKQRFNPYLLFKMLEKLHIEPYSPQGQAINGPSIGGLYQKRSLQNRIPTIFEPIVSVLNELAVWEQVARVLQYKIVRCEGKLQLANKLILKSPSLQSEHTLLFTLKLVRLCFQLNTLLSKYQQSADGHFVVRTLSAVNFLSRGKIGSQFATNASRNSILLSVVALLHLQGCQSDGAQGISWQAEQGQEEDTAQQALIQFINRNRQTLDFQQTSNFLRRPTNALYEAENSIVGVSLHVLLDIVRLSPECSLEHSLTTFLPLKEEEKTQLKLQVLNKLSTVVAKAVDDPRVDYRTIDFIYSLKHDCGMNKLHGALSNRLFEQFLKSQRKDAERSVSFKAAVTRYLLKELSQGNTNYQSFTEQFLQKAVGEMRFRDTILREGRQFKEMREVGKMVRNYHSKEHSLLSLNQLERIVEERAIVEIGRQLETLSNSIDILIGQMIRRKHSQGLLNCLCVLNHLILAKNLLLLEQDLPDSARTRPPSTNTQPRLYLRDPLQAYISQGGVGKHGIAQLQQKNNVVQWLLSRANNLSNKITSYFKFILTIDRYLYANNPVVFTVERPDIVRLDLFCHLALGSFNFTATELFGKNSTDAVETVQGLASNLLGRLTELTKREISQGGDETYKQGLRMVGYCLQWLRGKEKHGETASQYLIRKLQKNFQVLLPSPSHFLTPEALKVLLSALSMGAKHFSPEARIQVRQAVYAIVERYWQVLQRGLAQQQHVIGQLFQQAASVLILLPPEKNEAFAFELLVNIWTRQRNFQFFFNESRLMIELGRVCPQELVKLQPLTRCQIITALSPRYSRYSDDERRFDGVAWTWAMRVAAQLANHPLSILVVSQVSAFLKKYRERIQALFESGDKLSKSYLQDLQVALELLASLFSHDLWVNFNRKLAEEITYLLSHKLIRVFVLYAHGRLTFASVSSNDRQLSAVKCLGDEQSPFDSITQQTVFSTEMRIRVNYCLRNYCLVMSKAFRSSHYVETYFQTPVLEASKYFSSFWDGFGKQLTSLFVYASKQFKLWSGLRKLNEALSTMNQCASAPHSFVENGYLCTVGELPRNDYELYSDLYLLNYLLTELAAVHLLKERIYVGRFNSLMGTHADAFAKRIREHVEGVRVESKRIHVDMSQYVGQIEFNTVVELIESGRATK